MANVSRVRAMGLLLLAFTGPSCGSPERERVLTVDQVVPRIDELNGQTVSVAGYLANCAGYDCILFRNEGDAEAWARFDVAAQSNDHRNLSVPDHPMLGIGRGRNFDFDAMAAHFTHRNVVITGTITDICRFQGRPACTDRTTDLLPASIRAGTPSAPQ